jgi:hypothetical protein
MQSISVDYIKRIHGIDFHVTGQCKRCGECEKKDCSHFSMENGLSTCDTYGEGDYLRKKCYEFPNGPLARVVRGGTCRFKFAPVTEEDKKKYEMLLESILRSKKEYGNRSSSDTK